MSRYLRQITVRSVGLAGQARIEAGRIEIDGHGLDAEICALYLAGAGVGSLSLSAELVDTVKSLNSEIQIESRVVSGAFCARLDDKILNSDKASPLARGSQVARDVLAALLSGGDG